MQKVSRVSLVESAIDQLSAAIASGRWPVGTRIPTEAELCAELTLSRTTVREAVRALAHAGLLVTRQGDGTFVAAVDPSSVALGRRLSDASPGDVLDVRRALDVVAAGLAAQRRTDQDLAQLRDAFAARSRAGTLGDLEQFGRRDIDFHVAIARASHNAVLIDLYTGLTEVLEETVESDRCLLAFTNGDQAHRDLMAAIDAEDPTAATRAATSVLDEQQRDLEGDPAS